MYGLSRPTAAKAYGFAVLAAAIATLARLAVDPIAHGKGPFLLFAFAVVLAALYGGFRAGMTATMLSLIIGDYLFVDPRYTFFSRDAPGDSTMLILFAGLGVALSAIIERLNRAKALLQSHQRELEIANTRFRMAAEVANETIWEWDAATRMVSWSDLYTQRFGRPSGEYSAEWWLDHIHPEDRERVQSSFFGAIDGSATSWQCEYRMLGADGNWVSIDDRGAIARGPDGKALRVVGAMLDITEIKLANEQLERHGKELAQSNERLQRFAFAVSHDLQTPLRMIADYSRRLTAAKLSAESDRFAHYILEASGRMTNIIQDLLEFARVASQPAPPEACIDSNFIFDLALQHLRSRIQETGAQITSDTLPLVMANDTRLLRVFQNLVGNALKYCEQKPCVHVSAQRNDDVWIFAVQDNGIGIAPEYHERIFGMFQRLHGAGEYSGTGIGLATVKQIVESHGGRIWLESEVGKGSTFYFSLQAGKASGDPGKDSANAHAV